MEVLENLTADSNLTQLSNEITYRRYLMNKVNMKKMFQDLSMTDYIVMYIAAQPDEEHPLLPRKVYLEDIAERMQIPIYKASRIVGNLRDRGLLCWSHDGNGSDGTYVTITESGRKTLEKQEQVLKEFYGKVIHKFGKEKFIRFLHMMNKLVGIMFEELDETGGTADEDECE